MDWDLFTDEWGSTEDPQMTFREMMSSYGNPLEGILEWL